MRSDAPGRGAYTPHMTVHFIGAGPGAADLLTLRAVALLRDSPVVLYPGTYLDPGYSTTGESRSRATARRVSRSAAPGPAPMKCTVMWGV